MKNKKLANNQIMSSIIITYFSRLFWSGPIVYCYHSNCCLHGCLVILSTEKERFSRQLPQNFKFQIL